MNRFQKLALTAVVSTFLLIGVGGFVRAAGAGLGCPDWPKCFDRWIPPTGVSQLPGHIDPANFNFELAWIEYVNRLVGVFVGFLILATAATAWLDHRRERPVLRSAFLALFLVAFQGWFGGQVVAYELDPRFVTIHLLVALAIIGALIYATFSSFAAEGLLQIQVVIPRRVKYAISAVITLCTAQILVGALVRGSIDVIGSAVPNLERHLLLERVGWLDDVHRTGGFVVALSCLAVAVALRRAAGPKSLVARIGMLPAACAAVQFAAGVGLAHLALPPGLQVVHIFMASLLFGSLLLNLLVITRS